jgi:galactose mutarotase-like enzyme
MSRPRTIIDASYRGVDAVALENSLVRVSVLPEKGADVVELRDRRVDADVLFDAPHNWQPLDGAYVPSTDAGANWMDYYPGGWQDCLPLAGNDPSAHGAAYGIHGETSLQAWEYDVVEDSPDRAEVAFTCNLVRYPFHVERTLALEGGSSTLSVTERVVNEGAVELPYVWLQHLAYGAPLLSGDTVVDLPGGRVTVEEEPQGESPLTCGESFDWPESESGVDMRDVPPRDAGVHDLSYVHDLPEGWYAVTDRAEEFGVAVSFDHSLFESVWCWRAFGGFEASPFFGREYVLGLEPCTGWPAGDVPESHDEDGTGTLERLSPGETVETSLEVTTYVDRRGVDASDDVV